MPDGLWLIPHGPNGSFVRGINVSFRWVLL
jgi:hypothetical protein